MESYATMYAEAVKSKQLTELTAIYKKWEKKGDAIIGAFVGKTEVTSGLSGKTYFQYLFDTDDGMVKFHLGKGGDSEIGQVISPGCVYRIEFLGKEQIKGGRSVNTYKCVEIGSEGNLPAANVEAE